MKALEKKVEAQKEVPHKSPLTLHNLEQKRKDAERARLMLLGIRLQLSGAGVK